jgi:hypothetical protein
MVRQKVIGTVALLLLAVIMIAGNCFGQGESQGAKGGSKQKPPTVTIKAKIGDAKYMGGYFVQDQETSGALFIVNPNLNTLKKLHESGRTVSIRGYLPKGAEYLFIQEIDGKKYSAAKTVQKQEVP